ncbi:MAG: hypothetical protein ACK56I_11060, partial [bacterium]
MPRAQPCSSESRPIDPCGQDRPAPRGEERFSSAPTLATHQRRPTSRKRGSRKNSGGLRSMPWPMNCRTQP